MRIETTTQLYYDIRDNFLRSNNVWDTTTPARFKKLLASHNAIVKRPSLTYVSDYLGISPGIDVIEFHDEQLYTMFLLRYA